MAYTNARNFQTNSNDSATIINFLIEMQFTPGISRLNTSFPY